MPIPVDHRHPLHRLVGLIDAIVAIALTLLVLPLVDAAVEAEPERVDLGDFLQGHLGTIGGFLLSFVVILGLWRAHHDLFERLEGVDVVLRWLTFLWALTIVVTPFTTQLIIGYGRQPLAELLYIGVLLLSSLCQTSTAFWIRRHPELTRVGGRTEAAAGGHTTAITVLFAVALVVALLLPAVNYGALALLLLARPLVGVARRLRARTSHHRGPRSAAGQ